MRFTIIVLLLLATGILYGCGPKEIGEGGAKADDEIARHEQRPVSEEMRYPMSLTASPTERYLYNINRPPVMENVQEWKHQQLVRRGAISPESPEYRTIPKMRSPFRQ